MKTSAPQIRSRLRFPRLGACCAVLVVAVAGCGTVKMSHTARTGTEQLLLTDAWDQALAKIDFRPLTGVPVFLDTTNATAIDQGWITSSLRQAMLTQGVLLRTKAEQAQWIVEARVGAYGTDSNDWLLGISQTTIPPTFSGVPTGTIPEIALAKKTDQIGVAKLALFAYDRTSGQLVWTSGTAQAGSNAKNVFLGGVGPIKSGSIYRRPEFMGVELPTASDLTGGMGAQKDMGQRSGEDVAASPLSPSASAADIESFAP